MDKLPSLNQSIHAPVRLSIITVLISVMEADFNYLKEVTGTTDGNLSTHLSKLESAGYIKVVKTYAGKKPKTICSITEKGRKAYGEYIEALERYLKPPSV